MWNITTIVKLIILTEQKKGSVQLTCLIFYIYILSFKSSILHKIKNSLNRLLKLNKWWHCYDCSTVRALRYEFHELLTLFHSEIHCWRITTCTRNTTHDPVNIIIGLFWLLTRLVVSKYNYFIYKRVRLNYATTYHHPPPSTTTHYQPKYVRKKYINRKWFNKL